MAHLPPPYETDLAIMPLARRTFLASAPLFLAGCVSGRLSDVAPKAPARIVPPYYLAMYAPVTGEPFTVAAPVQDPSGRGSVCRRAGRHCPGRMGPARRCSWRARAVP